jgi:hypothetical protein
MTEIRIALIVLTVLGWGVFLAGFVWNGFTNLRGTTPEPDNEAEPAAETVVPGASTPAASTRRTWFRGRSASGSWSDEMSFAELTQGVRSGAWRRSRRLQQFLLMVCGFFLGFFATALLIGLGLGPVGTTVAIAIIAYVGFQMTRGFIRA